MVVLSTNALAAWTAYNMWSTAHATLWWALLAAWGVMAVSRIGMHYTQRCAHQAFAVQNGVPLEAVMARRLPPSELGGYLWPSMLALGVNVVSTLVLVGLAVAALVWK